jgi:hypothetical protein
MRIKAVSVLALFAVCALPLAASAQGMVITMPKLIPFRDATLIPKAIVDECGLPEKHAELFAKAAKAQGLEIVQDDAAFKAGAGKLLSIEIVSAGGGGNAFTGRSNSVTVSGKLTEGGNVIGNFSGQRTSSGGAFGGFKGACAIYGRDVETLSADIAKWLKNPVKDARLGELK